MPTEVAGSRFPVGSSASSSAGRGDCGAADPRRRRPPESGAGSPGGRGNAAPGQHRGPHQTRGHGGALSVESVEGEGATFIVTLPGGSQG